jgi:hypothetical protein
MIFPWPAGEQAVVQHGPTTSAQAVARAHRDASWFPQLVPRLGERGHELPKRAAEMALAHSTG